MWWFITPDGRPFFSNGVNVLDIGTTRAKYRRSHPEYAAFRFYPNTESWADATLARLRRWNFNTIGGWSGYESLRRGAMPFTVVLELKHDTYAPWHDLFSEETERRFDETARRKVLPLKDDPQLLGYFTDNELGWWDDTLFEDYYKRPKSNATRRVLMRLLREHYRQDFALLRRDFDTGNAQSFDALDEGALLTLRPGGRGQEVIEEFVYLLAERYYKLAHDAIRRYDPNHLILGDRYLSWYVPAVVRAAGKYLDVISTNYAADWTDGNISRFYLNTLHRLAGKPILVTEYYMCATENRSGNRNSSAGFPVVRTQRERAGSFRNNLTALARLPFVVGAHWFQYYDEPTRGRSDGEDYNMGLVDINNQPYEELTAAARSLHPEAIHARPADINRTVRGPFVIPSASVKVEEGLRGWNKELSFVDPAANLDASLPFADLYACWDFKNLYLAVHTVDFAEPKLYAHGIIPETERMTWTLDLGNGRQPVEIRFGGSGKANVNSPAVGVREWTNSVRFTLLVKVPAALLGKEKLRTGDSLTLNARLTSHSRAETMDWKGELKFGVVGPTILGRRLMK